jgi:hypothetical protein
MMLQRRAWFRRIQVEVPSGMALRGISLSKRRRIGNRRVMLGRVEAGATSKRSLRDPAGITGVAR